MERKCSVLKGLKKWFHFLYHVNSSVTEYQRKENQLNSHSLCYSYSRSEKLTYSTKWCEKNTSVLLAKKTVKLNILEANSSFSHTLKNYKLGEVSL